MADPDTETLPLNVICQRGKGKEVATEGHGWPRSEETPEGNASLIETLADVRDAADLSDYESGEQIGEMEVDVESRAVIDWELY